MLASGKFSENARINIVIENILEELCPFFEDQARVMWSSKNGHFS